MRATFLFVVIFAAAVVACGADLTNEERALFERCEAAAKAWVRHAEVEIRLQKQAIARMKGRRIGKGGFPTQEAKQEAIEREGELVDAMERLVKQVKARERMIAPPFASPLVGDQIGRIDTSAKVRQLIDERTMLADVQIMPGTGTRLVMITGVNTANLSDGDALRLRSHFIWKGSKSYGTVLGAKKTVDWFEVADINVMLRQYKEYQAEKRGQ